MNQAMGSVPVNVQGTCPGNLPTSTEYLAPFEHPLRHGRNSSSGTFDPDAVSHDRDIRVPRTRGRELDRGR